MRVCVYVRMRMCWTASGGIDIIAHVCAHYAPEMTESGGGAKEYEDAGGSDQLHRFQNTPGKFVIREW